MQQDQRAEELVGRYADPILRLSYAYLKNTHDAQDVCQTVFVKLLTEPRDFESPEHEKAYVLRMAGQRLARTCCAVPGAGGFAAWTRCWRSLPRRRRRARCLRR